MACGAYWFRKGHLAGYASEYIGVTRRMEVGRWGSIRPDKSFRYLGATTFTILKMRVILSTQMNC
jgi:hypothetical protein